VWRPIKPSWRFTHRDCDKQGSSPSYSRTSKVPLRINVGSQPVVTWEIKRVVQKGLKASSLVVERIIAISRCHLIRRQYWFSLGVNEGEKGWLDPFLIH
jgi:hypothetical protein